MNMDLTPSDNTLRIVGAAVILLIYRHTSQS